MLRKSAVALVIILLLNLIALSHVFGVEEATLQPESSVSATAASSDASVTAPSSTGATEPSTYVNRLKYPSLSVTAISNFFGKANADYNQYTNEVEVTYVLKSSQGILTTQWSLTYDPRVLKIDEKKNSVESICPAMAAQGVVHFDHKKGHITFNATDNKLFMFNTDDAPFVHLVFDVADTSDNQPQITKIDLTIDTLVTTDQKKESVIVRNFKQADLSKLSVKLGKSTMLTESNYQEPTTVQRNTAPSSATPDERKPATPEEHTKQQSVVDNTRSSQPIQPTVPSNAKHDTPKPPQKDDPTPVHTGNELQAGILLFLTTAGMVALMLMRKKVMLKLMLND